MEFLRNPTTIKQLSIQLISACDSYLSLQYKESDFNALVKYYASYHGEKLFTANSFNPTILNRIGKKRASLLERMLSGFQISM